MNRVIAVNYLSEIGVPDAADIVDELERRLNAAEQQAAVELHKKLERKAQALADEWFEDAHEERRPVSVELAALTRELWNGTVNLPDGMTGMQLEMFALDLYEQWDGEDFTTPDVWFWERGTCSAEYV